MTKYKLISALAICMVISGLVFATPDNFAHADLQITANTYFSSPTGTAGGTGTEQNPWDLHTALSQTLPAGSTLYLRGGTYKGIFISKLAGQVGNPIKIQNYPGERATIDGYDTSARLLANMETAQGYAGTTCSIARSWPIYLADLFLVDNEVIYIQESYGNDSYKCIRGYNGSTVSAHTTSSKVLSGGTGALILNGANVWVQGIEVTNSSPERVLTPINEQTTNISRLGGIWVNAPGIKLINNVIHDNGHPGIGLFSQAQGCDTGNDSLGKNPCTELYGNIVYGNGFDGQICTHCGSGVYTQNQVGKKYIRDNIFFRNFTTGINMYTESGYVNGFVVDGNTTFDNAYEDIWFTPGGDYESTGVSITNNYSYRRPVNLFSNISVGRGITGPSVKNITLQNNYFVSGGVLKVDDSSTTMILRRTEGGTVSGNTFVSDRLQNPSGYGYSALVNLQLPKSLGNDTSRFAWDNNSYFDNTQQHPIYNFIGGFMINELTTPPPADTRLFFDNPTTTQDWRGYTGFDKNSTFVKGLPTQNKIFVRKNIYEPGRANITIYNWEKKDYVAFSLADAGLSSGQQFEVRDAQNFYGNPIYSGTYSGQSVNLPVSLSAASAVNNPVAAPLAQCSQIKHLVCDGTATGPIFSTFVVVPKTTGTGSVNPPTTTPVIPTVSFAQSEYTVEKGKTVTIGYSTSNGTSMTMSPNLAECTKNPNQTNQTCSFTANSSSPITIEVTSSTGNKASASTKVTVTTTTTVPPVTGVPVINSFTANGVESSTQVKAGSSLKLAWGVTGGASVSLNYDFGVQTGSSLTISAPDAVGTYTYVLTASNSAGSVTKSVVVTTTGTATVPQVTNYNKPVGSFDGINNDGVLFGWVKDADKPTQSIEVHVYEKSGSATQPKLMGGYVASQWREDVGAYAFNIPAIKDGIAHTYYVWGIDIKSDGSLGSNNVLIAPIAGRTATVGAPPTTPVIPTVSFAQSEYTVEKGKTVTIGYSTSNGTSMTMSPNLAECTKNPNQTNQTCSFTANSSSPITIEVTSSTGNKASASTKVTVTTTPATPPTTGSFSAYLEAESADVSAPMNKITSAMTGYISGASGNSYITSATGFQGKATFSVTAPAAGTYYLHGLVNANAANEDSFYVSVNGGNADIFDTADEKQLWGKGWNWTSLIGRNCTGFTVDDTTLGTSSSKEINCGSLFAVKPRTVSLNAGVNTIVFRTRDANSKLDGIFITNNKDAVPTATPPVVQPPVGSVPVINSFTGNGVANSLVVKNDSLLTLAWSVSSDTKTVSLNYDFGVQTGTSKTISSPGAIGTYVYVLTATNDFGTVTKTLSVTTSAVGTDTPPATTNTPPTISFFTGNGTSDALTMRTGYPLLLAWNVSSNTKSVSLNYGFGTQTGTSKSITSPDAVGTYVYVLTASNDYGSVTKSITVTTSTTGTGTTNPVLAESFSIQAEAGNVQGSMGKACDTLATPTPCGTSDNYVFTGGGVSGISSDIGSLTLPFSIASVCTATCDYNVWARILAPSASADSFFVSVLKAGDSTCVADSGGLCEDVYDTNDLQTGYSSNWVYTRIGGRGGSGDPAKVLPRIWKLTSGNYVLKVRGRDLGTKVDKFYFTNSLTQQPQ